MGGPFVFTEFGVGGDFCQGFLVVQRDGGPSANTVFFGGYGCRGIPAKAIAALVKGETSPNIKARCQLPKQTSASFFMRHVEVIVGDEQPAKVPLGIKRPNGVP